jgi:hypothetical protein
MTKKKTKKRTSNAFLESLRHPIPPLHHPITRGMLRFSVLGVFAPASVMAAGKEQNNAHVHDFVIFGNAYAGHSCAWLKVRMK